MTPDVPVEIQYTDEQYRDQVRFFRRKLRAFPSRNSTLRIDEYAEKNRIMPAGNPIPGPWDNENSPYLKETMQNMSPCSPVQREIVMKGAQGGWTAAAENMICYYMDEMPADILFVSATGGLLERWASRRLEPAIDSCGIRSKLTHETSGSSSKKTGDKIYAKEYSGCRLDMASARSSPELSATDKRILIRDEVDRAPALLTTGEGSWMKVSYARTNFWGARRKVYDLATPTLEGQSQIHEAYKLGDQRKFLVPCPHCGTYQELRFGSEDTQYGLKPDTKAGKLIDAYYLCDHCHDAFFNNDKYTFLPLGYWEPTTESQDPTIVSRHWPAYYAPVGSLSWKEIYQHYLEALEDPLGGMQPFVNLYEGKPYKEESSRPAPEKITRGTYKRGVVPDGVLYLTAGVDVQAGKKKDKKKPPRLEMEICGHGLGYRTWSIDYKVIAGSIDDPYEGAWQEFRELFIENKMSFARADGIPIPLKLILIDSQFLPNVVYQFCESGTSSIFASKGFKTLAQRKDKTLDELTHKEIKRYQLSRSGAHKFYNIATVFYKRIVYGTLRIPRQPMDPQKPGFCEFPVDYPAEYYKQLTAEEMRDGGNTFWLPTGRTNEALDCRVLNLAASHIYLDDQIRQKRDFYKKQGCDEKQLEQIDSLYILNGLQAGLDAEIKRVREFKKDSA